MESFGGGNKGKPTSGLDRSFLRMGLRHLRGKRARVGHGDLLRLPVEVEVNTIDRDAAIVFCTTLFRVLTSRLRWTLIAECQHVYRILQRKTMNLQLYVGKEQSAEFPTNG